MMVFHVLKYNFVSNQEEIMGHFTGVRIIRHTFPSNNE